MRKAFSIIAGSVVIAIVWLLFLLLGSGTTFEDRSNSKDVFVPSGTHSPDSVLAILKRASILEHPGIFELLANLSGYENRIKPGRYSIKKNSSTLSIFRKFFGGRTDALNLVINKFRTKEDLASYLGRKLEPDSAAFLSFLSSVDSTKTLGLDTQTILTTVIPNTYSVDWNINVSRLMNRFNREKEHFWTKKRQALLRNSGLSREDAYILASIVEEETNKHDEKPMISSVYLNRMRRNMPLGADPTIKYALRDFAIKRISFAHIRNSSSSPYNTYTHKGLPPGPICTPSSRSIDAVLSPAKTDYIFFCARADFSGYHSFASTEAEHFRNARAYQKALDSLMIH